jgi:hypothetical protein
LPACFIQTKNPNLGKFLRAGMENVGIFYDHLEYIYGHLVECMAAWYSLWPFGIFFQVWYVWTKKNLATLDVFPASKSYAFKTGKSSAQALSVNLTEKIRINKMVFRFLLRINKRCESFQQLSKDGVRILKNQQKMKTVN